MKIFLKNLLSGFLAGTAICLGGYVFLFCKLNFGDAGTILGSFLFAFGLYSICLLHLHLYTGKIGYIIDQNKTTIWKYLGMLLTILIGNLLATLLFGIIAFYTSTTEFIELVQTIVISKSSNMGILFARSIGCGMLVLLAVYLFNYNLHPFSKFISIFIPIGIFVLTGMDHCIANMFYISFAMNFSGTAFLGLFLAILGNSIGSILLYLPIKYLQRQD